MLVELKEKIVIIVEVVVSKLKLVKGEFVMLVVEHNQPTWQLISHIEYCVSRT
jgi:hypothetical protein